MARRLPVRHLLLARYLPGRYLYLSGRHLYLLGRHLYLLGRHQMLG